MEDEVNPKNLPTVISDEDAIKILQEIEDKKIEVLEAEVAALGKSNLMVIKTLKKLKDKK